MSRTLVSGVIDLTYSDEDASPLNSHQGKERLRKRRKPSLLTTGYQPTASSEGKFRDKSPTCDEEKRTQTSDLSSTVFYVDLQPAILSSEVSLVKKEAGLSDLLLPSHVTVLGNSQIEIIAEDDSTADFIKYLDFDDPKEMIRYFDEPPSEEIKLSRTICKHCGAEGEHKTSACPVIICLTCGVRNEHLTRSCPISKVCFSCGMKGHINATCPNRNKARTSNAENHDLCDRCGSGKHQKNECPTWWRIYDYLTDDGRNDTLMRFVEKKGMALGHGGEGYIGDDEWCYSCGGCGHYGDDCDMAPYGETAESSAFGSHNILLSPFGDVVIKTSSLKHRIGEKTRNQDKWRNGVPDRVGRQGKKKSMERLEKRVREQEDKDDSFDWFEGERHKAVEGQSLRPYKAMRFSGSLANGRQFDRQLAPSSLLSRLGDDFRGDSRIQFREKYENFHRSSKREDNNKLPNRPRKDRRDHIESDRWRDNRGPRYKGGYTR